MKYFIGLMLLFTQIAIASSNAGTTANPELKQLHLQINELKQNLTELQKEVDELKLVKVTCICEVTHGSHRTGGYIEGKGVTVFKAEDNAAKSCQNQHGSSATTSVDNCLDQRLDNVRNYLFRNVPREPLPSRLKGRNL